MAGEARIAPRGGVRYDSVVRVRLLAITALALIACSDVQHRVPLDVGPDELAIVAVLDGAALQVARVGADESVRVAFPPDSRMVVWRFSPDDFVDAAGRPLDADELDALEVTTVAEGGCGRCTYDALFAPQRLSSGDVCALPSFGAFDVYENDGGPRPMVDDELVRDLAARVFLRRPGACGCEDRPLKPARDLEVVQVDEDEPRIAAAAHHLFADGTAFAIAPGHLVAVAADGTIRARRADDLGGALLSTTEVHDGLLVAFDDPARPTGDASYRHLSKDLTITRPEGLPRLGGPALVTDASGVVYLAGVLEPDRAPRHALYRCVTSSAGQYDCVDETISPGTCDETPFDFERGVVTADAVVFVGTRGQLYVRSAADGRWACHPGLSVFGFVVDGERYEQEVVDDVVIASDGTLYVCATGVRATGITSRHFTGVLWATELSGVRSASDLASPLSAVETAKADDHLCTSLSVAAGGAVRSLWGFGDFAIDAAAGVEVARHRGAGRPWAGAAPELHPEIPEPVLDHYAAGAWKLAVTASRGLYRRAPDATDYSPIYAPRGAPRGPMTALAAAQPGTVIAFGSKVQRYTRRDVVERRTIDVAGYPQTPDSHADVALVAPGAPHRALVTTHRALLWRCDKSGTTRTPCLPPAAPDRVSVLEVDLAEQRVVREHTPPIAQPATFVDGAALADDVFVLLDSKSNVFAMIDSSLELLSVEWDDPATETVRERRPATVAWSSVDGADGVAWLVGDGLVGRIAWRPNRRLMVEGFWNDRLGAPWTADDGTVTTPHTIDAWCADRAVVLGIGTTLSGTVRLAVRPWRLQGGAPSLALQPIEVDAVESDGRAFSKRLKWVQPAGALRFDDGALIYTYDEGTIEPRGGPRHLAPFSYVGGHAVSGDLALIGGEGERVVAVQPR